MTREELSNNISANIASITMGCSNIEITSAIMKDVDLYAPRHASKRPSAFRVPRTNLDGFTLSKTEWRYFADEDKARTEADALMADYQGLYVRDGTVSLPVLKSTQAMRDRIRELMNREQDDYDRAVECVLDDLEEILKDARA